MLAVLVYRRVFLTRCIRVQSVLRTFKGIAGVFWSLSLPAEPLLVQVPPRPPKPRAKLAYARHEEF